MKRPAQQEPSSTRRPASRPASCFYGGAVGYAELPFTYEIQQKYIRPYLSVSGNTPMTMSNYSVRRHSQINTHCSLLSETVHGCRLPGS